MHQKKPRLAILIYHQGGSQTLLRLLEEIYRAAIPRLLPIVIDDVSADGSLEQLRQKFPDILLLTSFQKHPWSQGINQGLRCALEKHCDLILFWDSRVIFSAEKLRKFLRFSEQHSQAHIFGIPLFYQSEVFCYSVADFRSKQLYSSKLCQKRLPPKQKMFFTRFAFAVRQSVFAKIGIFDEKFAYELADADLCLRAKRAGFRFAIANRLRVEFSELPIFSSYALEFSRLQFFHKHLSGLGGKIFLKTQLFGSRRSTTPSEVSQARRDFAAFIHQQIDDRA